MNNFETSLLKGLEIARIVESNHDEILGMFKVVDQDVKRVTNSIVTLSLEQPRRGALFITLGDSVTDIANAICLSNDTDTIEIGILTRSENGYPCTLKFGKQNIRVMDRDSLSIALQELLQTPAVGKNILNLMNSTTGSFVEENPVK